MSADGDQTRVLMDRAAAGDSGAWGTLLAGHSQRLTRVVSFRLDPRVRGRVDPADVVQEAYAAAATRRADFFRLESGAPLFVWLRGVVTNKLMDVHRCHLGARMRDAGREAEGAGGAAGSPRASPDSTSLALIDELTGGGRGPGTQLADAEAAGRVRAALAAMSPTDREVLALRHFEQLTNLEVAQVLGIQERAAGKRYLRALTRLKDALAEMPGGLTGLRP